MKVTIERTALLKALGHVHRIVERRNTIPILSNVLLDARDGQLTLKSTDLDLEATESAPADVAQAGATTVPAHVIYDIVRKLPEGAQVSLETTRRGRPAAGAFGARPVLPAEPAGLGLPRSDGGRISRIASPCPRSS